MTDREGEQRNFPDLNPVSRQEQHNTANHAEQRALDRRPLDDETLEQSAAYYEDFYRARAEGPQLEGLPGVAVKEALRDPRTIAVELSAGEGRVVWPLLTPIEYNAEYRPEFFDDHLGEHASDNTFYFSDPGEVLDGSLKLTGLADEKIAIASDSREGRSGEPTVQRLQQLAATNGIALHDYFADTDEADRPRVLHFTAKADLADGGEEIRHPDLRGVFATMVAAGEAELHPQNGATILQAEDIANNREGLADDIWTMYQKQFDDLILDHPSMQEQPKESMLNMLADPETLSAAYFEEGKIKGLSFFVQNIEKCDWLNVDYYRNRFPDDDIAYFPGIVVDEASEGRGLSLQVIRMFSKVAAKARWAPRLVFQCTQLSANYVPRLVELGVNRTEELHIDTVEPLASYRYDVMEGAAVAKPLGTGQATPSGVEPYTSEAA